VCYDLVMPELPEVETIRRDLEKGLVGLELKDIDVRLPKIFQGGVKDVVKAKVEGVWRRAKILGIDLSNDRTLLFHLKLTGQLVFAPDTGERVTFGHPIPFAGAELPGKTTHVIFSFDGAKLFFNDLRQFGWVKVLSKEQVQEEVGDLGVEPLTDGFTPDLLREVGSKTRRAIKILLMDQKKIAGIGNIYANDALFEAGVHPKRPANSLSEDEVKRLHDAVVKVLKEGLKYGGSSAADEAYIKPSGEPGGYQDHFRVYQRDGEKCPKCGATIKRFKLGGRGTFYCPQCQPA
jgi:formamidopyrimidine-DNA glycosylase